MGSTAMYLPIVDLDMGHCDKLVASPGAHRGFYTVRTVKTIVFVLLSCLILANANVTLGAKKRPITSFPIDWPHRAPWQLFRELLLPEETDQIVFVVDVPRGSKPTKTGLRHLVEIAALYGEREAVWVWLGTPDAPAFEWVSPDKPTTKVKVTVTHREFADDSVLELPQEIKDTIRYMNEVVSCPEHGMSDNSSYVFVRYLGMWGQSYGSAGEVRGTGSCSDRMFPVIYLGQDQISLKKPPGLTQAGLEARALVHEYGHILGLGNPAHGRWAHTLPYSGGPHCVNRGCALAVPNARALLKGLMLDYCSECKRDIEEAKTYWRTGKEFPEIPRLPQPDPAKIVGKLKDYQFRHGGEAEKLVEIGKPVLSPLMDRLNELPGKKQSSPRCIGALIAKRIIAAEQVKRQGSDVDYLYLSPKKNCVGGLHEWWAHAKQAFIAGDDWDFPSKLIVPESDVPAHMYQPVDSKQP